MRIKWWFFFKDAPDSPKVDDGMVGVDGSMDPSADPSGRPSRHLLYTTHFPLPQV